MKMKYYILLVVLFCGMTVATAQKDSTQTFPDIVCLTSGGIIRGEVLSFDPKTGALVFKDYLGRTRFLAKEDYKYFKEDEPYKIKRRDRPVDSTQVIERKSVGFNYRAGLSAVYTPFSLQSDETDDFERLDYSVPYTPINLTLQGGYQMNQNIVLLQTEIQLNEQPSRYFQAGLRYERILTKGKRNQDWYLPFELTYSKYLFPIEMAKKDTLFTSPDSTSYEYPTRAYKEQKLGGLNIGAGIGTCFYFANKSSLRLEINLMKYMIIHESHLNTEDQFPQMKISTFPVRFMVNYEF